MGQLLCFVSLLVVLLALVDGAGEDYYSVLVSCFGLSILCFLMTQQLTIFLF